MKAAAGREAFFAIDGQRRVMTWAPEAEALLGFGPDEVLGRPCWHLLKGSDVFGRPLYCERCQACLDCGVPAPAARHFLIRHRDGHLVRLVHELVPLPSGPQARALVLLAEASPRPAPVTAVPGWEAAPLALTTFGGIVKGLAALGLLVDSLPSASLYQTLDATLNRALNLTGAEAAEVFLWSPFSQEMCLTAHQGLFRSAFRQITRFGRGQGFPGLVAASGEPLVTQELLQDPRFLRTRVKDKGVRFYASVPLLGSPGVIGCLNLASRRLVEGQDSPLQFLSWLATPLASAVELTLLRSQLDGEWPDGGDPPGTALPRQLLKAMVEVAEADQGIIALWNTPAGDPLLVESHPHPLRPCFQERDGHRCPVRTEVPYLVQGGPAETGRGPCRWGLEEARTAICLRLTAEDRPQGVASLRFLRPQPVPTRPLALLGALASRAGRLLEKAWPTVQGESEGDYPQPYVLRQPQMAAEDTDPEVGKAGPSFVDIRCFGSFQVLRDGKPLTPLSFGRRQCLTVLKVLVTRRGRPVSTDFLTEALWPEAPPEAATKRLWVVIHSLRMGLEPGLKSGQASHFIRRDGDSYSFSPGMPYRLDVERFLEGLALGERLGAEGDPKGAAAAFEEAAHLYQGDFLEEEAYSDWCSAEREYLREIYLTLLKKLAFCHAASRDWDRSIAWHRRALLVDGLREEVHRELMRCLRLAGRRDEALRQYQECRLVLDRELGVEPLPETSRIYREILEEEKHSSAS